MSEHIVVDGRVFATEAADRGMGRFVRYVATCLAAEGYRVTVAMPMPNLQGIGWPSAVRVQTLALEEDPLLATATLNRYLDRTDASAYVDATPFLPPDRYDVYACPVIAVLYDLIPMRFPGDYFASFGPGPVDAYINGLARVQKADHVIAISEHVKGHALRYLGIPGDRCTVVTPGVSAEYRDFAARPVTEAESARAIVCIQGAHRSKNFPTAIGFLSALAREANRDVDVIVPTPTQRTLVERVRQSGDDRLRICDSLSEERKFALQRAARVIAHLSLEEGYGIPLAEALYLHRPVMCIDNAINRELLPECEDPRSAGILLLGDPRLASSVDLRAAVAFVASPPRSHEMPGRRRIVERLIERQEQAGKRLATALDAAKASFARWHSRAGLAVVAPTEIGSCGVSDYCHALVRSDAPRYVLLLGTAPRDLQLQRQLRLLPHTLLDDVRRRTRGMLFNLAVSDSLTRAFDAVAVSSAPDDVLVVHDAGSYLPGLLMQANASGDRRLLYERYLDGEPDEVRKLSARWLDASEQNGSDASAMFLAIDRSFRSMWLRRFHGRLISHHAAFAAARGDAVAQEHDAILSLLAPQSEILERARYAPMPIDPRANPGISRLAIKMRWALGLARDDLLVCCAGSVVRGKYLDVVAQVIARLDAQCRDAGAHGGVTLMLAGRVLDGALFADIRAEFAARNAQTRLLQIVEADETRYDALLAASDVVVAFREQRRIQMSHSYVRALALGRPIVTNEGAGFDDREAAALCRDACLDEDLARHLIQLRAAAALRASLGAASQSRYRARHTVEAFFAQVSTPHDAAAVV